MWPFALSVATLSAVSCLSRGFQHGSIPHPFDFDDWSQHPGFASYLPPDGPAFLFAYRLQKNGRELFIVGTKHTVKYQDVKYWDVFQKQMNKFDPTAAFFESSMFEKLPPELVNNVMGRMVDVALWKQMKEKGISINYLDPELLETLMIMQQCMPGGKPQPADAIKKPQPADAIKKPRQSGPKIVYHSDVNKHKEKEKTASDPIHEAYVSGDTSKCVLEAYQKEVRANGEKMHADLRNKMWAKKIAGQNPQRGLVVVGAAHLVDVLGHPSVIGYLQEEGYTVTQWGLPGYGQRVLLNLIPRPEGQNPK